LSFGLYDKAEVALVIESWGKPSTEWFGHGIQISLGTPATFAEHGATVTANQIDVDRNYLSGAKHNILIQVYSFCAQ